MRGDNAKGRSLTLAIPVKTSPPRAGKWLEGGDVRVLAKLPLSGALAWGVPQRYWDLVTSGAARLQPRTQKRLAQRIEAVLGAAAPASADQIARRHLAMLRLDQLAFLRSYAPNGWPAELTLHGLDHLLAALAVGRGAILWTAPTVFAPLIAKRTLHEAGYPPHHLSHPAHGFSSRSHIGRALLNPLRTRVEDRYLAERVMLGEANEAQAALRKIGALLRKNAVVSISVGRNGSRTVDTPLLGGTLTVASGAPQLAMRLGAALLPVVVWRTDERSFVTRISSPLTTCEGASLGSVAAELAGVLEPFALAHPEQMHWDHNCIGASPA